MKLKTCNKRERKKAMRYRVYQARKNLEENGYRYQPTQSAISYAEFVIHDNFPCYYNGVQPVGVKALKEVIMFFKTYEAIFVGGYSRAIYHVALKVALRKVWGQRFTDLNETPKVIRSTENVEQAIREALRAMNITAEVNEFLMQYA